MQDMVFWGLNGEYGPFLQQTDGWPVAGEVVRYYRRALHMRAEELAIQYSEAIGVHVSERWILKMEQQNKVPTDLTRRRVLVKILGIPPVLLGLASLDQVTCHSAAKLQSPAASVAPRLVYKHVDPEWYDKEIRVFWQLHYAQSAQNALPDILHHIDHLNVLQQTAKGSLEQHLNKLLNSYYRLASTLQRDRGNFAEAYGYANESVRSAKAIGKSPDAFQIIAASQYTRGVANLAWGAFGNHVQYGRVVLETEKIEAALVDFERALQYASPQLKGILYSEMARATALNFPSATDVTIALRLIENAEAFVNSKASTDDFYTQILLNGDVKGLDKRRLILGRAKTFQAIHRPAKVLDEMNELERLKGDSSHTRRRGWTRILFAQAAFECGNYTTAITEACNAFNDCHEVHALPHLARIQELHRQLLTSPYKLDPDVKRLGKLLGTVFSKAQ